MRYLSILLILLAAGFLAAAAGCSIPDAGVREPLRVLCSGVLDSGGTQDMAPPSLYIDFRDQNGRPLGISESNKVSFSKLGYRLVEKPSDAGNILHVTILASDQVSRESLEALVRQGYGSPARFSGSGANGLLADMLLVRRKVPAGEKSAQKRLKNIARRNALGNSQMRIGLYSEGRRESGEIQDRLRDALLRETRSAMPRAAGVGNGQ